MYATACLPSKPGKKRCRAGFLVLLLAVSGPAEPAEPDALAEHFTSLHYNSNDLELTVQLKGWKQQPVLYRGVPPATNQELIKAEDPLNYYRTRIEPVFSTRPMVGWNGRQLIPLKSNVFEGVYYNESGLELTLLWKNGHAGTFTGIAPALFDRFLADRYKAAFYQMHIMKKYEKPETPVRAAAGPPAEPESPAEPEVIERPVPAPSAAAVFSDPQDEAEAYLQDLLTDLDAPGASVDPPPSSGPSPEGYELGDLFSEVADWETGREQVSPQTARTRNLALYLLEQFQTPNASAYPEPEPGVLQTNAVSNPEIIAIGLSDQEQQREQLVVNPLDTRVLPLKDLEGLLSNLESEKPSRWSTAPSRVVTNAPRVRVTEETPAHTSPPAAPAEVKPKAPRSAVPREQAPDQPAEPAVLVTADPDVNYQPAVVLPVDDNRKPMDRGFLDAVPPPDRQELEKLLEEVIRTRRRVVSGFAEEPAAVQPRTPVPAPLPEKKDRGFFSRLFGKNRDKEKEAATSPDQPGFAEEVKTKPWLRYAPARE